MQCAHLQICFNCWWSRNSSATCVVHEQFTHRPSQFHPLSSMKWNLTSVVAWVVVKIGIVQLIYISVCWRFRHHNFKQYVDICDIGFLDAEDVTRLVIAVMYCCVLWQSALSFSLHKICSQWRMEEWKHVMLILAFHSLGLDSALHVASTSSGTLLSTPISQLALACQFQCW